MVAHAFNPSTPEKGRPIQLGNGQPGKHVLLQDSQGCINTISKKIKIKTNKNPPQNKTETLTVSIQINMRLALELL